MKIKIGTRGSRLAILQTKLVLKKLKDVVPELEGEIKVIKTTGDLGYRKVSPGAFVNEINQAVLRGEVDIGVHSLKDLPTKLPDGLELACVPDRASPNDALISRYNLDIYRLPKGSIIGTSSPRRIAEISSLRSDLKFREIRGNVDTRIKKMEDGNYDGIVVALAALERLGMEKRAAQVFELDAVVPAPGQGAIAVVKRRDVKFKFLEKINDVRAWNEVICERAFLEELGGGCRGSAGAVARVREDGRIDLIAVIHEGGRRVIRLSGKNPVSLGKKAGRLLGG